MEASINDFSWFDAVGDTLTRLTLDLRAAIRHATNTESRIKAFALLHMSVNASQKMASGVWGDEEEAAKEAAIYMAKACRANPGDFPEWLRITVDSWRSKLNADLALSNS